MFVVQDTINMQQKEIVVFHNIPEGIWGNKSLYLIQDVYVLANSLFALC